MRLYYTNSIRNIEKTAGRISLTLLRSNLQHLKKKALPRPRPREKESYTWRNSTVPCGRITDRWHELHHLSWYATTTIKGAVARYCACTAMIDSGSWLTNRNRQKRRPATMQILRDFEVFAGTTRMFENKLSGLWPFSLKNKESDRRATMASNIPEVQVKKNYCLPSL